MTTVNMQKQDRTIIAKPTTSQRKSKFKRYTLQELLKGVTPEAMQALHEETAWAREDGKPIGHETT